MSKAERCKVYLDRRDWTVRLLSGIKNPVLIEVGVHKADYGCLVLDVIPDLTWYGIDPYTMYGRRLKLRYQRLWDVLFLKITKKVSRFGGRFILVRKTSDEAVNSIPDNSVDFVFIDGNHDYDYVLRDLKGYEKKVKKGGIMAAHDYKSGPGKAIAEHIRLYNRDVIYEDFDPICGLCWWRR